MENRLIELIYHGLRPNVKRDPVYLLPNTDHGLCKLVQQTTDCISGNPQSQDHTFKFDLVWWNWVSANPSATITGFWIQASISKKTHAKIQSPILGHSYFQRTWVRGHYNVFNHNAENYRIEVVRHFGYDKRTFDPSSWLHVVFDPEPVARRTATIPSGQKTNLQASRGNDGQKWAFYIWVRQHQRRIIRNCRLCYSTVVNSLNMVSGFIRISHSWMNKSQSWSTPESR